jgi:hypothetical protein
MPLFGRGRRILYTQQLGGLQIWSQEDTTHERMMDKTTQPSDADMIKWIGHPIVGRNTQVPRWLLDVYPGA